MGKNTPELNTLDRFSKASRLILEEHGHCEVPAGCGGVVLRWRNPKQARPARIWFYTPGVLEHFLIDGKIPGTSRPLLSFGKHVLAIKLSGLLPDSGALSFAAIFDPSSDTVRQSASAEAPVRILSRPDRTWRATSDEPSEGWADSNFDDSTWKTMVADKLNQPDASTRGAYQYKRVAEFGGRHWACRQL